MPCDTSAFLSAWNDFEQGIHTVKGQSSLMDFIRSFGVGFDHIRWGLVEKYTWGSRQFTSRRSTGAVGMMYQTGVRWFLAGFLYVGIFSTNVAPAQTGW